MALHFGQSSENCVPGAQRHLLPEPTNICILQPASRDKIPLLGKNITNSHINQLCCTRLFVFLYEYVVVLNHISADVCMCVCVCV